MTGNDVNMIDLILRKRSGLSLTDDEIGAMVEGYTTDLIPDYQMSSFLMASFLNGLNETETLALTKSMLHSGQVMDLSDVPGKKVDKHSTGGVGDKMSIVLAPLMAACGIPVPMISGRGLGHTGGTLDKLEAIPGFRTSMTSLDYRRQLEKVGVVMIGQTKEIAPADRKMYALRDATGTVEYIPFIASSILSKKLAEGIDALVLDVKVGSGAMMQNEADARRLAETMTDLAVRFGTPTTTLLTDMNEPLGRAIGNWPEIVESIECLHGRGPEDVMEVTLALADEMLIAGDVAASSEEARALSMEAITSGRAFRKFVELVEAQGGNVESIEHPESRDAYRVEFDLISKRSGTLSRIDSLRVGRAAVALGAGRAQKEDAVDPLAGIVLLADTGDFIEEGMPLARIQATTNEKFEPSLAILEQAFSFDEETSATGSRIIDRYQNGSWMNP